MVGDVSMAWLCDEIDAFGGSDDLAESVSVALGSDRRAEKDDDLPDLMDTDLRGVWSDTDAKQVWNGWPVGCKFWLLRRAKILGTRARGGSTIARVNEYIDEAIKPFIDIGVASRYSVDTKRTGLHGIGSEITIFRGPKDDIALRFQYLWQGVAT